MRQTGNKTAEHVEKAREAYRQAKHIPRFMFPEGFPSEKDREQVAWYRKFMRDCKREGIKFDRDDIPEDIGQILLKMHQHALLVWAADYYRNKKEKSE